MGEHQSAEELAAGLLAAGRQVVPGLHLVESRVLARVIRENAEGEIPHAHVAHTFGWWIPRTIVAELASADELGPAAPPDGDRLDDVVLLLSESYLTDEGRCSEAAALHRLWRALFHMHVDANLDAFFEANDSVSTGGLLAAAIDAIGQTPFDEIRAVLKHEGLLLPEHDDRDVYREFVAVLLELERFEPRAVERYFPSLAIAASERDGDDEIGHTATKIDADAFAAPFGLTRAVVDSLVQQTKPEGAPAVPPEESEQAPAPHRADDGAPTSTLADDAARATEAGNWVRSAIALKRIEARSSASSEVPTPLAPMAASGWATAVEQLGAALSERLALPDVSAAQWLEALTPLVALAACPGMSPAARFLLDLQNVALSADPEAAGDDAYKLDLYGWVTSLGRQPLRRPVPTARLSEQVRTLKRASTRLNRRQMALTATQRSRLDVLVDVASDAVRGRLRTAISSEIRDALSEVGLRPESTVERVALDKLVAELGDQAVSGGVIHIGQIRDALSRNDLKLNNLEGIKQFATGDQILKIDRRLGRRLLGIYRRGEIYMRLLQRVSSILFGTTLGRLLTLHAILPAGGAYMLLQGFDHVLMPLARLFVDTHFHATSTLTIVVGTVLLYGLIHSARFRSGAWSSLKASWRGIKQVTVVWPRELWNSSAVQKVWRARAMRHIRRYVLKPAFVGGLIWMIVPIAGGASSTNLITGGIAFATANLILNSRRGRRIEEAARDGVSRSWHNVRHRVVPGFLRWVMQTFRAGLEMTERALYRVDEYLRFNSSDSRFVRLLKAITGVAWSAVAYVVRFYVNLLIEPQVNPIKHFPVVTVAHKLMIPMLPELTRLLSAATEPVLGKVVGASFAVSTVFLLPGVAGFLVWELKENWKLYRQNRRPSIAPSIVGHHSETVARLMRPGFHSGTLPKLYARLRRHRSAVRPGALRRARAGLADVQHAMEHFVEREFLALLGHSRVWGARDHAFKVAKVRLASNIIRVEVTMTPPASADGAPSDVGTKESAPTDTGVGIGMDVPALTLIFEEQSGWLVASVALSRGLDDISTDQRAFLELALTGLFKRAGVDLLRSQISDHLGPVRSYDVSDEGLVVWPGPDYSFKELRPIPRDAAWVFSSQKLLWDDWASWVAADTARASSPDTALPTQPLGRILAS